MVGNLSDLDVKVHAKPLYTLRSILSHLKDKILGTNRSDVWKITCHESDYMSTIKVVQVPVLFTFSWSMHPLCICWNKYHPHLLDLKATTCNNWQYIYVTTITSTNILKQSVPLRAVHNLKSHWWPILITPRAELEAVAHYLQKKTGRKPLLLQKVVCLRTDKNGQVWGAAKQTRPHCHHQQYRTGGVWPDVELWSWNFGLVLVLDKLLEPG